MTVYRRGLEIITPRWYFHIHRYSYPNAPTGWFIRLYDMKKSRVVLNRRYGE